MVSNDPAVRKDYVVGLVSVAIFIFVFFLLWLIVLAIFKCMGYKSVGFFSGHRVVIPREPVPPAPSNDMEEMELLEDQVETRAIPEPVPESAPPRPAEEGAMVVYNNERSMVEYKRPEDDVHAINMDTPSNESNTSGIRQPTGDGIHVSEGGDPYENDGLLKNTDRDLQDEPDGIHKSALYEKDGVRINTRYDKNKTQHEYEKEMREHNRVVAARKRRVSLIRIVVIICCIVIIVMAILMIVKGGLNLIRALNEGENGLENAINLTDDAITILDEFQAREGLVLSQALLAGQLANAICPSVRPQVCRNFTEAQGCNYTDIPTAPQMMSYLVAVKNAINEKFDSVNQDLENMKSELENTKTKIHSYRWAFWVAAALVIVLAIISLILMFGAIGAWERDKTGSGGSSFFSFCCLGELFVLLVFLVFIFSMVFVAGSLATGDACYNSPNSFVSSVIENKVANPSTQNFPIVDYALWIVNGCQAGSEPAALQNFLQLVLAAASAADQMAASVGRNALDISNRCNTNPNNVFAATSLLGGQLCLFAIDLFQTAQFFSCPNWHPLYDTLAYQATCYQGMEGLSWICNTQIVIVVMAMIICTLRAAFKPIEYEPEFDPEHDDKHIN